MKRETITQALGGLDDRFVSEAAVYAPGTMQEGPERIVRMKKKRFLSIVLAAALILALGITAYAAWSTHAARQEEIKADLKIEENNVSSYAEYPVPEAANSTVSDVPEAEGSESELVLLSAVNAGEFQRVYVNISPVSEKCIADYPGYPGALNFSWSIDGTDLGGYASPRSPSGITLHGQEAIRDAVLQYAYDRETQTLTLECIVENMFLEKAAAALGTELVVLLGDCADPYNPKTVRAAMGALFRQRLWETDLATLCAKLREWELPLCGAALRAESVDVKCVSLRRAAIAVGNEGRGLTDALLEKCDTKIILPMTPGSESLNAAVAASILMWEMWTQRG